MRPGYKHHTRWNFGDWVWHRATREKGMIVAIKVLPESKPQYFVVFTTNIADKVCDEFELTDEEPIEGVTK